MVRVNNYLIQAQQAKTRFLTYDQEKLIKKLNLQADDAFLYMTLLYKSYRLSRTTGDLERLEGESWQDANTFEELLTLLDLLCDSRDDRYLSGRWQNMQTFGLQFHQNLLEDRADPFASRIDKNPEFLHNAAKVLAAEVIPGLSICVRRLHDIGKSGWYYLIGLIPLVGGIIMIVWFCQDSAPANQWGPNPKR